MDSAAALTRGVALMPDELGRWPADITRGSDAAVTLFQASRRRQKRWGTGGGSRGFNAATKLGSA